MIHLSSLIPYHSVSVSNVLHLTSAIALLTSYLFIALHLSYPLRLVPTRYLFTSYSNFFQCLYLPVLFITSFTVGINYIGDLFHVVYKFVIRVGLKSMLTFLFSLFRLSSWEFSQRVPFFLFGMASVSTEAAVGARRLSVLPVLDSASWCRKISFLR